MQARGATRIETVEVVIDGRMSSRSGSDDPGSSLGNLAAQFRVPDWLTACRAATMANCETRSSSEELR